MRIIEPPAGLPITVGQLADQLHFDDAEAAALGGLIAAATDVVEAATNRPILTRTVEVQIPDGSWGEFWFPCAPVQGLVDADGADLVRAHDEPHLRLGTYNEAQVRAVVGYADPALAPRQLLQAIILLVGEWREAQISIGDAYQAPAISFGVHRLLRQVRYRRPRVVR